MKYLLLSLMTINIASASTELEARGWLTVKCHSNNKESSFEMEIANDEVGGVNQITNFEVSGPVRKALETEATLYRPIVALVKRVQNDFLFKVRYTTGLKGDTYLDVKMTYKPEGYLTQVDVTGIKGVYFSEFTEYQCSIGNRGRIYLQTTGY